MNCLFKQRSVHILLFIIIQLPSAPVFGDQVKDFEVSLTKGEYAIELKNYDEAIRHLTRALELRPDDHTTMAVLGIAYSRAEQYEKARDLLQKAVAADPQNARARYELGVVLAHLKQYGEAHRLLATVSSLTTEGELSSSAKALMEGMRPERKGDKPALRIAGGLQYDSNVLLEPDHPVAAYGRSSDWRGVLSVLGSYPFLVSERSGLEASYQLYQSLHAELEDYNVLQHDVGLTGNITIRPWMQAAARAGYAASFVGSERYSSQYGIRPSVSMALLPGTRTQVSAGWETRRYVDSSAFPRNSGRTGGALTASVSHMVSVTKDASVQVEYGYERDSAEASPWDAEANRGAVTARGRIGASTIFAGAQLADWTYGPSPQSMLPDRRDRRWECIVGGYRDLTRTVRISVANQYILNDSNLDIYAYRRDIIGVFVEVRL